MPSEMTELFISVLLHLETFTWSHKDKLRQAKLKIYTIISALLLQKRPWIWWKLRKMSVCEKMWKKITDVQITTRFLLLSCDSRYYALHSINVKELCLIENFVHNGVECLKSKYVN